VCLVSKITGRENPADLSCRSCRVRKLVHNQLWWEGPEYLKNPFEMWPNMPSRYDSSEVVEKSKRSSRCTFSKHFRSGGHNRDIERLFRITSLVLRFVTWPGTKFKTIT